MATAPCAAIKWRSRGRGAMARVGRAFRPADGSAVEDVVQLERLALGRLPGRAVGGAPAPALVDRQLERLDQGRDLLARRHMREIGTRPQGLLVERVERGQAAWKELAKHHALGEAVDGAEAEPRGELVEPFPDQFLIAGTKHRQAV